MKTILNQNKYKGDLEQGKITAINKLTGRVSLFMKNGLQSAATYLYDINDLRVGMSVLYARVDDSYIIINKMSNVPGTGMSVSLPKIKKITQHVSYIDGDYGYKITYGSWHNSSMLAGLDGSLHIVYAKTDINTYVGYLRHAVSYDHENWIVSTIISDFPDSNNLVACLDKNSKCHILFRKYPDTTIYYSNNVSGSWSAPVDIRLATFITNSGASPNGGCFHSFCVGSDDSLHCVISTTGFYVNSVRMYSKYARYKNGSWELMLNSEYANDIYLITQKDSTITLFYSLYYPYSKVYFFNEAVSSLPSPVYLSEEENYAITDYGGYSNIGSTKALGKLILFDTYRGFRYVFQGETGVFLKEITTPYTNEFTDEDIEYFAGLTVWGESYCSWYYYTTPFEYQVSTLVKNSRKWVLVDFVDDTHVFSINNTAHVWEIPYTNPGYYNTGSSFIGCYGLFVGQDGNGYYYNKTNLYFLGYKYT